MSFNICFLELSEEYCRVFLSYRKNIVGTQKRVRMSHGKRAIEVRVIEILLYSIYTGAMITFTTRNYRTTETVTQVIDIPF